MHEINDYIFYEYQYLDEVNDTVKQMYANNNIYLKLYFYGTKLILLNCNRTKST